MPLASRPACQESPFTLCPGGAARAEEGWDSVGTAGVGGWFGPSILWAPVHEMIDGERV